MTRLVVDPLRLKQLFADASVCTPERIRIIGQVVEYLDTDSRLTISMVPTILDAASNGKILVNVESIVGELSTGVTKVGAIVSIEGFYDGNDVNVFDIYEINGASLLDTNATTTMLQMTNLSSMN
jgi:hypothetical protein